MSVDLGGRRIIKKKKEGPGRWLESLTALRPDLALERDQARLSTWDDAPWAGAAYSISSTPEQATALVKPVAARRSGSRWM